VFSTPGNLWIDSSSLSSHAPLISFTGLDYTIIEFGLWIPLPRIESRDLIGILLLYSQTHCKIAFGISEESKIVLSKNIQIKIGLLFIFLVLIPSGIGQSQHPEDIQLQNKSYLPIVFNNEFNQISPTKTPKPTQTRTPTQISAPFRSSTPIPTATQTSTSTLTPTVTPTQTYTPTTTLIPMVSITIQFPSQTPTHTHSPTPKPKITQSPTPASIFDSGIPSSTWIVLILIAILWSILGVWLYIFLRQRR
jgi:hypothetical protein